jgi:phytoene/squalene synthetase
MTAVLDEARATTNRVARTFAIACRLLPRHLRNDVYLLYLVFRTLDDLVDHGDPAAAARVAAVRAWARGETSGFAASEARGLQTLPTALDQQARAEFGLAEWLARHGARDAAERHFARAGELAPHDFTIRRGSMPIRGIDPMGPQFREMLQTWVGGGRPYYRPLPDTRG